MSTTNNPNSSVKSGVKSSSNSELRPFIDAKNVIIPKAQAILKYVGNLSLKGSTGTGKTHLAQYLAQINNAELFSFQCRPTSTEWDLIATDTFKGGNTETRKGIVLNWLECKEKTAYLYLDEINVAQTSVVTFLNSLCDDRGEIFVPQFNQTFKRTNRHKIIISFNPYEKSGYSGVNQENIATMRRFEHLYIPYMDKAEEINLIKNFSGSYEFAKTFVELASKTRVLYQSGKLKTPLTTGNLINYAKMKPALTIEELTEIASNLYPESEQKLFMSLSSGTEDRQISDLLTKNGIS